ncbi:MAG: YitT family protein, partial [Bacteroidia bacterium]|nr:YitT family protein [Bacteroidia bacterium]
MTLQKEFRFLEEIKKHKLVFKQGIRSLLFIFLGVLSASIGLKGFLLPNNFIDGGAVGIALLISFISSFNLSLLLFLINLPFLIIGIRQISVAFSIKSTFAIL